MTFAVGVLSFLQITFLPGYCVAKLCGIERIAPVPILAFALSHVFNYALVVLLRATDHYDSTTVGIIVGLEIAVAVWLARQWLKTPVNHLARGIMRYPKQIWVGCRRSSRVETGLFRLSLIASLVLLALFVAAAIVESGSVFGSNDAIFSWNLWARGWAGATTKPAFLYPQLLPANWSITYVLMGTDEIEVFAKAVAPLYVPTMIGLLIWWAAADQSPWLYVASGLLGILIPVTLGWQFLFGYADIVAAMFGLLAFYCGLRALDENGQDQLKLVLAGATFATAGALSKQAGISVAVAYAAFVLIMIGVRGGRPRLGAFASGIILTIVIAVYATKASSIPPHFENPAPTELGRRDAIMADFVVGLGQDPGLGYFYAKSMLTRAGEALQMVLNPSTFTKLEVAAAAPFSNAISVSGTIFSLIIGAAMLLAFLAPNRLRLIFFLTVIPHSIMWALFWSYDTRNLLPIMPLFSIVAAAGLAQVLSKRWRRSQTGSP
jgi:hypothetical protein